MGPGQGRCDRSPARSAWDSATPKRLSLGYRCDGIAQFQETVRYDEKYSGNMLTPIMPYPTGRYFPGALPRHFEPSYDRSCSGSLSRVFRCDAVRVTVLQAVFRSLFQPDKGPNTVVSHGFSTES